MNTFYFNTGVKPYGHNPPLKLTSGEVIKGGTVQIPFDCEAPLNATLLFLCDDDQRHEASCPNIKVFEVTNTAMVSKYAYFRLNEITPILQPFIFDELTHFE